MNRIEMTSLNIHAIANTESKTTSSWRLIHWKEYIQHWINKPNVWNNILRDELNWQNHMALDDLMIVQFSADIQRYLLANNFSSSCRADGEEKFLNFNCMAFGI